MAGDFSADGHQQRRQFGRREVSRSAIAVQPGAAPVQCTVENLSEAGAMVVFGGAVPTRNFRLTIEDAAFAMVCEIRHQSAAGVGVRFLNPADGARLMAHLFPGPVMDAIAGGVPVAVRTRQDPVPALTTRDLRQRVLTSLAERSAELPLAPPEDAPKRRSMNFLASLASLGRSKPVEAHQRVSAPAMPHPTTAATPVAPRLPDELFRGYQPKRSRRNGIKGTSAGGMG